MTNPHFKPQIGQAGLEFIPVGIADDLMQVGRGLQTETTSPAWKLASAGLLKSLNSPPTIWLNAANHILLLWWAVH